MSSLYYPLLTRFEMSGLPWKFQVLMINFFKNTKCFCYTRRDRKGRSTRRSWLDWLARHSRTTRTWGT
jgi:hypothetical protein